MKSNPSEIGVGTPYGPRRTAVASGSALAAGLRRKVVRELALAFRAGHDVQAAIVRSLRVSHDDGEREVDAAFLVQHRLGFDDAVGRHVLAVLLGLLGDLVDDVDLN